MRQRILHIELEERGEKRDGSIVDHIVDVYERLIREPCKVSNSPPPPKWTAAMLRRHFGMGHFEGCKRVESRVYRRLLSDATDDLNELSARGYRYRNRDQEAAMGEWFVDSARLKNVTDARNKVQQYTKLYHDALGKEREELARMNLAPIDEEQSVIASVTAIVVQDEFQ